MMNRTEREATAPRTSERARSAARIPLVAVITLCLAIAFAGSAHAQEVREDSLRIRFGVDGGFGVGVLTGPFGEEAFGALAASGRLGLQFGALVGLYYQMGGWVLGRETGTEYQAVGDWSHTLNVDFTIGNFFQFGVGAGVDLLGENFDVFPSFDARLAFMVGTSGPGSRGAFAFGLKSHFTIDTSGRDPALLAIPILFLGFELF